MMLVTVRPGPVLHIWQDGKEAAVVPLSPTAALALSCDLLAALPSYPQCRKGSENG